MRIYTSGVQLAKTNKNSTSLHFYIDNQYVSRFFNKNTFVTTKENYRPYFLLFWLYFNSKIIGYYDDKILKFYTTLQNDLRFLFELKI